MRSSIIVTVVKPSISTYSRHGRCPSVFSQVRHQSTYSLDSYLVTPAQLSRALSKNVHSRISTAPRVIPLCAAWFMPNDPQKRTGYKSFLEKRIPTARFFDLDKVKDDDSPFPHMLPSPETFSKEMGKLGIRRDDSVVVYDTAELGIFSAPRVAWTLRVFGHDGVHILNNFKLWVEQGLPTEKGEPSPVDETYYPVPELDKSKVVLFEEMKERALERGKEGAEDIQLLDARSQGRFDGTDPEPRPGETTCESIVREVFIDLSRAVIRSHACKHKHTFRSPPRFAKENIHGP